MLLTQIFLVLFGLAGAVVSMRQANIAQLSADSADRSVSLAQKSERDARLLGEKQLTQSHEQFA